MLPSVVRQLVSCDLMIVKKFIKHNLFLALGPAAITIFAARLPLTHGPYGRRFLPRCVSDKKRLRGNRGYEDPRDDHARGTKGSQTDIVKIPRLVQDGAQ